MCVLIEWECGVCGGARARGRARIFDGVDVFDGRFYDVVV